MCTFDRDTLMIRVNYDEELMSELIEMSLQDLPERISTLIVNLRTKNYDEIALVAHTIKGASLNMAFDDVAHAAMELEYAAKNKNFAQVQSAIEKLEGEYRKLKISLSA